MTSVYKKKDMWISRCDTRVIVDNFVETGDFSWDLGFLDKYCSLIFSESLQEGKFKIKKVLVWSILKSCKLTKEVFSPLSYTES